MFCYVDFHSSVIREFIEQFCPSPGLSTNTVVVVDVVLILQIVDTYVLDVR